MPTMTLAPVSVLPRGDRRAVAIEYIADLLAEAIDGTRYSDATIDSAVASVLNWHEIMLPGGMTAAMLADDIMIRVFADEIYDSELSQALRASSAALTELFAGNSDVAATGWVRGTRVLRGIETFTLTGRACPRCEINPECYGTGGGSRCLDISGCGWGFCY